MLTASMKGLVALSGLEAMSNGIQFVINEDFALVKWGKTHLTKLNGLWNFYSGKAGIGRLVQTSFLFYGGITTAFLTYFAIHFNAFDGVAGRSLVANLSFIGFSQIPGGTILYWAYQILAVGLLAAASMTAFQDLQATEWRDVAIGEIPEIIVYRDKRGTFTRSVTIAFAVVILIIILIRGKTALGIPYYGIGVFMPIMMMGFAVRKHILRTFPKGAKRSWGAFGAGFAALLSGLVFVGQIVGKWTEGGWIVLISFSVLGPDRQPGSHLPHRSSRAQTDPPHRAREGPRPGRHGLHRGVAVPADAGISLQPAGGNHPLLAAIRDQPARSAMTRLSLPEITIMPLHVDHPGAPSLLEQYLDNRPPAPKLGGKPRQTAPGNEEGKIE